MEITVGKKERHTRMAYSKKCETGGGWGQGWGGDGAGGRAGLLQLGMTQVVYDGPSDQC